MQFEPCFPRLQAQVSAALESGGYRLEVDVPIPMRDGVRLATDLYFPAASGPHPVLIERTPYGKHQSVMVNIGAPQYLARHGFVVAIQDVRGCYASEGTWYPFLDDASETSSDGYDSIEWLAAQPFCDGKVGTFGGSYAGFNQYMLAENMPPHLAAMFPRQAPAGLHTEWTYRGGALEYAFLVPRLARRLSIEALRNRMFQLTRKSRSVRLSPNHDLFSDPFQWLHDYLNQADDEHYWKQWDRQPHYAALNRPAFHVGSWFDIFFGGTLQTFAGARACAESDAVRRGHRLIIGPWIHGPFMDRAPQGRLTGELDCGEVAQWDYSKNMLRWFEFWLKGIPNGIAEEPAVRYFVMGINRWRDAEDWPPPGLHQETVYFREERSRSAESLNDGSLAWEPAMGSVLPVAYIHDPGNPVQSLGGATLFNLSEQESAMAESWDDLNAQAGSRDQRAIEDRCLTFTSAPLAEDLEITGPVTARIYLSSSAVDTDLVVRLCDVHTDGRSMLLCDGIQRARYRESRFKPQLLEPGKVYLVEVDLWATSNVFRRGHRIRVIVNSSCWPRFDVNPGTGRSEFDSSPATIARNQIYVDREHPSHIILPVRKN